MLSKKLTAGLIPVGLVAGVVAIAIAVLPAVASATTVTPAKTAVTAKLVTGTESTFTPENGSFPVTVKCAASETSGETPSGTLPESGPPFYNNNPHSTANTSALAGGSVLANLATPTFTDCASAEGVETKVLANETNGKWSIDWNVLNSEASPWTVAAIGVPKAGAVITLTIPEHVCHLTVDPETAQGVVGYWENGTSTTESKLYINEQVFFAATAATLPVCEAFGIPNADSPAVFRASYTVADSAGEGVIEKWS